MIYLPNLAQAQITQLPLFPQENKVDNPVEIIKVVWSIINALLHAILVTMCKLILILDNCGFQLTQLLKPFILKYNIWEFNLRLHQKLISVLI